MQQKDKYNARHLHLYKNIIYLLNILLAEKSFYRERVL